MLFNGAWEAAVGVSFLVTVPVDSDHKSGTFDGFQARPLGLHHLRRHSADEYGEDGRRQELWRYPLVLCCFLLAFPFCIRFVGSMLSARAGKVVYIFYT